MTHYPVCLSWDHHNPVCHVLKEETMLSFKSPNVTLQLPLPSLVSTTEGDTFTSCLTFFVAWESKVKFYSMQEKMCIWGMLKKVVWYSRSPGSYTQGPCSGNAPCTGRHSARVHSVDFQRTWKKSTIRYFWTATQSRQWKGTSDLIARRTVVGMEKSEWRIAALEYISVILK